MQGLRFAANHLQESNHSIDASTVVGMGVRESGSRHRLETLAFGLIPFALLLCPARAHGAHLQPATAQAWEDYVQSANTRLEERLVPGNTFLWADESPERLARIRTGDVIVSPVGPNPKKVPSGLIHDWVGTVFVRNISLKEVLFLVRDYGRYKDWYQPGVVDSKVLSTSEGKDRFSMLLINKSVLLKTAFDADYESCYVQVDDRRAYSVSRTTRVQQIEDYGFPSQHVLQEGEGSGIIWRLLAITRYLERDGGVYVEFEAIGLSRDIPLSFRWFVDPIVRRVSRSSLETSLQQTAKAACERVDVGNHRSEPERQTGTERPLHAAGSNSPHTSVQSAFGAGAGQVGH